MDLLESHGWIAWIIIGGIAGLYAMRKFMKSREVPVKARPRPRR